jgi:hypothetical protein
MRATRIRVEARPVLEGDPLAELGRNPPRHDAGAPKPCDIARLGRGRVARAVSAAFMCQQRA